MGYAAGVMGLETPTVTLGVGSLADFKQLTALSESVYGFLPDGSSERYYRWQYEENPWGRAILGNAECGGELVGHYALVPRRIWLDGHERLVGLGVNALTNSKFQGRAIFARLADMVEKAAAREGIHSTYVVPSPQSEPWFLKKLHYAECAPVELWVRPLQGASIVHSALGWGPTAAKVAAVVDRVALFPLLRAMQVRRNPYGLEIRPVEEFGQEFDSLWQRTRDTFLLATARTSDYLRWRFSHASTRRYQIWGAYRQGSLVSYLAVRLRELRQYPGLKVGVIADLFGTVDAVGLSGLKLLVSHALTSLSREGAGLCMMQLLSPQYEPVLSANGFVHAPRRFSERRALLVRLAGSEQAVLPGTGDIHFTGADHDMG